MSKSFFYRVGLFVLAIGLSACGVNMSGEPEIVRQSEIEAQPTSAPTEVIPEAVVTEETGNDTTVSQEADFNLGRDLYLANCTACHAAEDGTGPGLASMRDRAPDRIEGMAPEDYLHESIVNPSAYIVEGYEDIMPKTYGEQFSEHEINSLVKFINEFTPAAMMAGASTATPAGAGAPEATMENISEEVLTVSGKLIQGTADGEALSGELPIELRVYSVHGDELARYNGMAAEDGTYTFENVNRAPGNIYFALLDYDGVVQGAQAGRIEGNEENLKLDVPLYETTTDRSSVAITWAQMLINYAPIEEFGVEVRLDLEMVNTSDKIVIGEPVEGQEWTSSVSVELPVAAFGIQPMQAEGSTRYQVELVDSVPVLQDTWPLRPEQVHTITVLYYLPYESSAVFDQAFGYPLMDAVVLLPNDTVEFDSDQFADQGEWRYRVAGSGLRVTELDPNEEISPNNDFTLIQAFDLLNPLGADDRLIFSLNGRPSRTVNILTPNPQAATNDEETNMLPFVLAGAGIGILLMAVVMWWRQRSPAVVATPVAAAWHMPSFSAGRDDLLQAMAELDDTYQAGEIDEETYFERREKLKERLIPLMDEDDHA